MIDDPRLLLNAFQNRSNWWSTIYPLLLVDVAIADLAWHMDVDMEWHVILRCKIRLHGMTHGCWCGMTCRWWLHHPLSPHHRSTNSPEQLEHLTHFDRRWTIGTSAIDKSCCLFEKLYWINWFPTTCTSNIDNFSWIIFNTTPNSLIWPSVDSIVELHT